MMSYLISLNPQLFKNIAHDVSFKNVVFVFVTVFVFVFVFMFVIVFVLKWTVGVEMSKGHLSICTLTLKSVYIDLFILELFLSLSLYLSFSLSLSSLYDRRHRLFTPIFHIRGLA